MGMDNNFRGLMAAVGAIAIALSSVSAGHADELPGMGKTVRYAQDDSLGANYVQNQILIAAMKKLGYEVKLTTVGNILYFQAASQGDLDIQADVNFPQREPAFRKVGDKLTLVGDGAISGGGINGYLIDKRTADAHGIKTLDQMKDPKIAGLFGANGKAELISCDPGWSCGDVVDFQIDKFGLKRTVHAVRGKYEALMAETVAKVKRGEPVFYYAWSPSWVNDAIVPGKDVVWLPTPFDALPPGMPVPKTALVDNVKGCAADQNPCRMAMGAWNWRVVANREFVDKNHAIKKLAEVAKWPIETWALWESEINETGSTDVNIKKIADKWIADNQSEFDSWIAEASSAK